MKFKVLVGVVLAISLSFANDPFRAADTFLDEESVVLKDVDYSNEPSGASQRFARSFENAPPLIPHDLEGLIPITTDLNMCVTCHMPELAEDVGSTAIPKSHLVDLRSGDDNNGELDSSRYFCTLCHVPQFDAPALVENKFQADFRDESSKNSSNLIDILNQGVR